jgi:hypothetical protein
VPVSSFIQVIGNSEQWKMTGQKVNVGFLATESGVQQFQLSLWGCFVLRCRRFFPELHRAPSSHHAQSRRHHRRRSSSGGLVGKPVGPAWGHGRSEDRLQVLDAGHLHRQRWLRGVQPSSVTPCHFNRRRAISGQQTKQPSALRRKPAFCFVARAGHCGRAGEVTPSPILRFAPSRPPRPLEPFCPFDSASITTPLLDPNPNPPTTQ